jgi:hypothetical protein
MREQFKAMNPGMSERMSNWMVIHRTKAWLTTSLLATGFTFGQLAKYTSAMYAELPQSEKEAWQTRAEADKARYLHELASYVAPDGFDAKGDAVIGPITSKSSRKGKAERDVAAPKRNLSPYLLYQNAMRDQFKRENPGMGFGQLAKYTSHMYKHLTPEEKATWEARAQQDKARYDAEIQTYVPPPGHDAHGVVVEDRRPRKKQKRMPKDPNAPKRASGSYVFFTNDMRPKVLQEFPGIKFTDLGRVLGGK